MREILFHGQRKDNGEWVEGYLFDDGILDSKRMFIGSLVITEHKGMGEDVWDIGHAFYEVIPETVGQFTGLTDKNGTKIFEGDIIKQSYYLGKGIYRDIISSVEYGIGYAYSNVYGVCQRFKDGSGEAMLTVFDKYGNVECEIIGNIHDNPELLGGAS